jgi:DNA-binding LytR/AlgR family response regulator
MSLQCVIVDDEYLAIKILEEYISRITELNCVKTFTHPEEALRFIMENKIDLLFLDIQMPYLNGFELLKKLPLPPMVIFTTAHHDYAVQAFELDVLDYLVKPISFERFDKAIHKVLEYDHFRKAMTTNQQNADFLMVKADYRIHKVMIDHIEYIEGLSEYVKIHTVDKTLITLAALKDLMNQLPHEKFIRIHKSYIVALSKVESYTAAEVRLRESKKLPIGRSYRASVLQGMERK